MRIRQSTYNWHIVLLILSAASSSPPFVCYTAYCCFPFIYDILWLWHFSQQISGMRVYGQIQIWQFHQTLVDNSTTAIWQYDIGFCLCHVLLFGVVLAFINVSTFSMVWEFSIHVAKWWRFRSIFKIRVSLIEDKRFCVQNNENKMLCQNRLRTSKIVKSLAVIAFETKPVRLICSLSPCNNNCNIDWVEWLCVFYDGNTTS